MSDLISRQAAIDVLDNQIEQCDKALGSFDISMKDEYAVKVEKASLTAYKEQLEYLPSSEPERKTGKWIDYSDEGYVECPFCHSATNCEGNKDELHYCFSCGAELRGEEK